jgi:hypothetical protein
VKLQTRRERRTKDLLKRAGIAVFLLIFVASIVGVAVVSVAR